MGAYFGYDGDKMQHKYILYINDWEEYQLPNK